MWAGGTPDLIPDAFTFTDQTSVALSSLRTSNTITVSGLSPGYAVTFTVTGAGGIDKNGSGSYLSSQSLSNGDTFRAQHTSSGSVSTAVNTTVTANGISDTFTSTTLAFSPTTVTYNSGSGTETVPAGAVSLVITGWGAGAGGVNGLPGTGGGGGGEFIKTVSVSGGQTFSYTVGASGAGGIASSSDGGASTVTSASPVVSLTANGGKGSTGGFVGGTATGGDTNTSGNNGGAIAGGASPSGGATQTTAGAAGNAPGGGGAGNTGGVSGGAGAQGRITFAYT